MQYGMPYMGSKNGIAEWVVDKLPTAPALYDLFGGGGAISHCALLSLKYRKVYFNDIQPLNRAFETAANGGFSDDTLYRWLSREEYNAIKDTDPIAAFCWTFGYKTTNRRYMYAVEIEPWKKALHSARVFRDFTGLKEIGIPTAQRSWIEDNHEEVKQLYCAWYMRNILHSDLSFATLTHGLNAKVRKKTREMQDYLTDALKLSGLTAKEVGRRLGTNMERHYFGKSQWSFPTREHYERMRQFMPLPLEYDEIEGLRGFDGLAGLRVLQNLEELKAFGSLGNKAAADRMKSLRHLSKAAESGRIEFSTGSYSDFDNIPDDAVIYCDIPYRNTCGYSEEGFDYEAFYTWAERQRALVVISEYSMPEDRFECVAQTGKRSTLSADANNAVTERLFVPRSRAEEYRKRCGYLF